MTDTAQEADDRAYAQADRWFVGAFANLMAWALTHNLPMPEVTITFPDQESRDAAQMALCRLAMDFGFMPFEEFKFAGIKIKIV